MEKEYTALGASVKVEDDVVEIFKVGASLGRFELDQIQVVTKKEKKDGTLGVILGAGAHRVMLTFTPEQRDEGDELVALVQSA